MVDPKDYASVLQELDANKGATTLALRRKLAAKAYARTASYDSAIANWFATQEGETFPERLTLSAERVQTLSCPTTISATPNRPTSASRSSPSPPSSS